MEGGPVKSEERQYGFFVYFRHVSLQVSNQRQVCSVQLKLVDICFLHIQEIDLILARSFLDTLDDVLEVGLKLWKVEYESRDEFHLRFRVKGVNDAD